MIEFEIAGHGYRSASMPLRTQFHVTRRLAPVLGAIGPLVKGIDFRALKDDPVAQVALFDRVLEHVLPGIAETIAAMSDADSDYVINACLQACERRQAVGGWARVMVGSAIMFADLTLPAMMQITYRIMQDTIGPFFGGPPSPSDPAAGQVTTG